MDMSATASVMPLVGEQANLPHVPGFTSELNQRSFATSFDEIAESVGEFASSMPVGHTVKEKTTPFAKEVNTAAGLLEATYKMNERLKGAVMPTNTAITKNVVGGTPYTQGKATEELAPAVPFGTEEKTASQEIQIRTDGIDVSNNAASITNRGSNAAVEDSTMEKISVATKLDSMERRPIPEDVPSFSGRDGERPGIQVKPPIITAMSTSKKTPKKEPMDKDQSVAVQVDSKKYDETSDNIGLQTAISVSPNGITPFVVNVDEIHKPGPADFSSVALQGDEIGEITSKRSQFNPRTDVEMSTLDISKNEKAGSTTKTTDDLEHVKKDLTMSSKATEGVSPTNKRSEGRTVDEGEMNGVSITHGVTTTSSGSVAAEFDAGKIRMDTAKVATASGLKGTDADGSSVVDGHRMLEATPTTLEVGIPSGTHGWLKIRAEIAEGGVVNASVSATTSAGQEMLHRELSSLTTYLQQEQIGVGSLVLHTATATGSQELAGGMERGAGREQMQQRGGQEEESKQDASGTTFSDSGEAYVQGGLRGIAEITTSSIYTGGSWLSVRA